MTISAAIISTIIIRLTVYTETKADTAESREAASEATRADLVKDIREDIKIH
jgi:hypothetical protein